MQNIHYVSGFLYFPASGKILLQQKGEDINSSAWSLFSGKRTTNGVSESFQKIIFDQLNVNLKSDSIKPIYDYKHTEKSEIHFIYYAQVTHENLHTNAKSKCKAKWFSLKEINKISLKPQVRHDIMIGARVILANQREKEITENSDASVTRSD